MTSHPRRDNEAIARMICEQGQLDGLEFQPGRFVAIADGRVIGVGSSFEEADALLAAAGFASGDGMVCEVAAPELDVIRLVLRQWP